MFDFPRSKEENTESSKTIRVSFVSDILFYNADFFYLELENEIIF